MKMSLVRAFVLACAIFVVPLVARGQRQVATDQQANTSSERIDAVLTKPVTVRLSNMSLRQALHAVTDAANVRVQYHIDQVEAVRVHRSINAVNESLGAVLQFLFAGTNLHAIPVTADAITIRAVSEIVSVADGVIMGRVVHAVTKQPVSGATVFLDGEPKGIAVGSNGEFKISAPTGEHRIAVRAVGFVR